MSNNLSFSVDARVFCTLFSLADCEWSAIGSGCVFMRRNLVLTAKHVVEDRPSLDSPIRVANGLKDGVELVSVNVTEYWCHPDIDIALLKLTDHGTDRLKVSHPLFPSHFSFNDRVGFAAVGYDRASSDPQSQLWVNKVHHVSKFSTVQRNRASSDEYCIEFDAPWIAGGYSGGPLLSEGGGVIGVIIQVYESVEETGGGKPSGRGRATSIYPAVESFLTPFEQSHGYPIANAAENPNRR